MPRAADPTSDPLAAKAVSVPCGWPAGGQGNQRGGQHGDPVGRRHRVTPTVVEVDLDPRRGGRGENDDVRRRRPLGHPPVSAVEDGHGGGSAAEDLTPGLGDRLGIGQLGLDHPRGRALGGQSPLAPRWRGLGRWSKGSGRRPVSLSPRPSCGCRGAAASGTPGSPRCRRGRWKRPRPARPPSRWVRGHLPRRGSWAPVARSRRSPWRPPEDGAPRARASRRLRRRRPERCPRRGRRGEQRRRPGGGCSARCAHDHHLGPLRHGAGPSLRSG